MDSAASRFTLDRSSLIDQLSSDLEARISSTEFPPGARLPGEAGLAAEYGVGRSAIREVLARLRERGFVDTRNGLGTFARLPSSDDVAQTMWRHVRANLGEEFTADHLYEARALVESHAIKKAATSIETDQLHELERTINEMRNAIPSPSDYAAADYAFHAAIVGAAQNPFLMMLMAPLHRIVVSGIVESTVSNVDAMLAGVRDHSAILERLREHDEDGSYRALLEHLENSRAYLPDHAH